MRTFLIIIGATLIVIGLPLIWITNKITNAYSPTYRKIELISNDNQENLYIKTKNWGVTDDSQLTIITTENDGEFDVDSTKQIVFNGLEPFIYKASHDTLNLMLYEKVVIPKGFNSTWTINQVVVDNITMMNFRAGGNGYKGI